MQSSVDFAPVITVLSSTSVLQTAVVDAVTANVLHLYRSEQMRWRVA